MSSEQIKHFSYGEKEVAHLKAACKKMSALIDKVGKVKREINPNTFAALVRSIVGQQISTKAASTVWARFVELVGVVTPENILRLDPAAIQKCGLSQRKVGYIIGIAESAVSRKVDFSSLGNLTDDEIIEMLSALPGVGVWTAEMLLISALGRPDVMSFGDLGIRRGLMNLHSLDSLTRAEFLKYKELYSPYGTVASFYLWELINLES